MLVRLTLSHHFASAAPASSSSPTPVFAGNVLDQDTATAKEVANSKGTAEQLDLWFGGVFPLSTHPLDIRSKLTGSNKQGIEHLLPPSVNIVNYVPVPGDGGVLVTISPRVDSSPTDRDVSVVEKMLQEIEKNLREHPVRMPFCFSKVEVHRIRGIAYPYDILKRYPARRLQVDMMNATCAEADLYALLRPFGKIVDIVLLPKNSSESFRSYLVTFVSTSAAVAVRCCLDRVKVQSKGGGAATELHIKYAPIEKISYVTQFFHLNPKFLVPFLAALIAIFSYTILEPLREVNIVNRITGRFSSTTQSYRDMLRRAAIRLQFSKEAGAEKESHHQTEFWSKLSEHTEAWLSEPPRKILVLSGPQGSGKLQMIEFARQRQANNVSHTLTVDFSDLFALPPDRFLSAFASAMGCIPGFGISTTANLVMDMITPGASKITGSPNSNMIPNILEATHGALKAIHNGNVVSSILEGPTKISEFLYSMKDRVMGNETAPAKEKKLDESKPRPLPLIVFNGFTEQNREQESQLLPILARWAALVTEQGLARVIFTSVDDLEPYLLQFLPDTSICNSSVRDMDEASAIEFVRNHAANGDAVVQDEASRRAIALLGGRYSDLSQICSIVRGQSTASVAVEEMMITAMHHTKLKLLDDKLGVPLWDVFCRLADSPDSYVSYDKLLFAVFKGQTQAFKPLLRYELGVLQRVRRPGLNEDVVIPYSPLQLEVFRRLRADPVFEAGMMVHY